MTEERRSPRSATWDLALFTLLFASLLMPGMALRDLWNPNEPIYGEAVREMAQKGEWLVPTVNDQVFAEKPILYYWLARVGAAFTGGVWELPLRLPSLLAALAGGWMLYVVVLRSLGFARARTALLLYATTHAVVWGAQTAQMDILVLACAAGMIVPLFETLEGRMNPARGWAMAGLAAGLGFLAKGPVAWICGGLPVLTYALAAGRWRRLVTPAAGWGALVCLVVGTPWYLLLASRGEWDFLYETLIRQNFTRFVNPWDHQAPWWYYGAYLWLDMAPWAWLLLLMPGLRPREERERRLHLLAWAWLLSVVIFFSLSQSKRSAYILPVAPAVAILASRVASAFVHDELGSRRARAIRVLALLTGFLFLLAGGAVWTAVARRLPELAVEARGLGLVCLAGGGMLVLAALRHRSGRVGWAAVAVLAAFYAVTSSWVLPALDVVKSPRTVTERLAMLSGPGDTVLSYRFWRWRAGYRYYLGRPIQNVTEPELLLRLWERPDRVFLIVEEPAQKEVRDLLGDPPPVVEGRVGSRRVFVYTNRWERPESETRVQPRNAFARNNPVTRSSPATIQCSRFRRIRDHRQGPPSGRS